MKEITPNKPSFLSLYWRPWKEDANMFDSYLDYIKDTSLVKYAADSVGVYIKEASKDQVEAINRVGKLLGFGISVLSDRLTEIKSELNFLNRKLDIQIEQQQISNFILGNIAELLRVPNSEKERLHSIELGLKFYVKADLDEELFDDALEELLKAEQLMKQDYFVLHRIGMIYLFSPKHINPEKALDYFTRAAKYASVENDINAVKMAKELLFGNLKNETKYQIYLKSIKGYPETLFYFSGVIELLNEFTGIEFVKEKLNESLPILIKKGIFKDEADSIKGYFDKAGSELEICELSDASDSEPDISSMLLLAADSYEKAAFASYILGNFDLALLNQAKAFKFNNKPETLFYLAKYQARAKQIQSCIQNLELAINSLPSLMQAVFKDFDLINEPDVLKLIEVKNENSNKLNKEKLQIQINKLIENFQTKIFPALTDEEIKFIINKLNASLNQTYEESTVVYEMYLKKFEDERLKIGSKYAGGIVFFIDKSGKHGLVTSEKELDKEAVWGAFGKIGTLTDFGSGKNNTKLIVEKASWNIEKGLFSNKSTPIQTAARICTELTLNGYNDWFLPSREELNVLLKNLLKNQIIKGELKGISEPHRIGREYLSSSEENGEYDRYDSRKTVYDEAVYGFHLVPWKEPFLAKITQSGWWRDHPHYFRPVREF